MTVGTSNITGKSLGGTAHLYQSIADILTTPIGSRVLRREYGSRLHERIDDPMGPGLVADIVADTAEALDRWEPRFKLSRVFVTQADGTGKMELALEGTSNDTGEFIGLEGIQI